MDFHYLTYFLNGFLMIVLPIGLAVYLTRKFGLNWRLFWIGAATFIVSQVLHIPFNALVGPLFNKPGFLALSTITQLAISAIFLGISAGIFEEFSRYITYRWFVKDARSWGKGLLLGTGHGGVEAIILGAFVLYYYLQMIALKSADLTALVPAAQLDTVKAQVLAYWSAPWYMTMLGAVERLFTIPMHLACSLLVLQAFTRNRFGWVGLAVLFHALADGMAVFTQGIGLPALAIEGVIGLYAVASVLIIFALRQPDAPPVLPPTQPIIPLPFTPEDMDETNDSLERTRYQ
jgi:uncharacterized membrane protein YhfC